MIAFCTPNFDLNGFVVLSKTDLSNIEQRQRRVSRAATLDGGVELTDMGYTDGDRSLSIRAKRESIVTEAAVKYLLENYPLLLCSTRDGFYIGAIQSMGRNAGELTITFLIQEKLAEA